MWRKGQPIRRIPEPFWIPIPLTFLPNRSSRFRILPDESCHQGAPVAPSEAGRITIPGFTIADSAFTIPLRLPAALVELEILWHLLQFRPKRRSSTGSPTTTSGRKETGEIHPEVKLTGRDRRVPPLPSLLGRAGASSTEHPGPSLRKGPQRPKTVLPPSQNHPTLQYHLVDLKSLFQVFLNIIYNLKLIYSNFFLYQVMWNSRW